LNPDGAPWGQLRGAWPGLTGDGGSDHCPLALRAVAGAELKGEGTDDAARGGKWESSAGGVPLRGRDLRACAWAPSGREAGRSSGMYPFTRGRHRTLPKHVGAIREGQHVGHRCEFWRRVVMPTVGGLVGAAPDLSEHPGAGSISGVIVLVVLLWYAPWEIPFAVGGRHGERRAAAAQSLRRPGARVA